MAQSVPLIDLTPFYQRENDPAACAQLLAQVDAALRDIGFLCVTGTRLDPAQVGAAQQLAIRFFDSPQTLKDRVRIGMGSVPFSC